MGHVLCEYDYSRDPTNKGGGVSRRGGGVSSGIPLIALSISTVTQSRYIITLIMRTFEVDDGMLRSLCTSGTGTLKFGSDLGRQGRSFWTHRSFYYDSRFPSIFIVVAQF